MNAKQDYISDMKDVSKDLNLDLNFPKIHLMSHWVKQFHRLAALPQYCG
jgi:hypothetical protein